MSSTSALPLLVRLAEAIPPCDFRPYRYSTARQVGEVLVNGAWRVTTKADGRPNPRQPVASVRRGE